MDYIIVGLGLAGLALSCELEKNKKSFIVFEDHSQTSSGVAGGMYNPVILKRFTPVWDAENQLKMAMPFYKKLEGKFNEKYDYPLTISRVLQSVEEQNKWFTAADRPLLSKYMIPKIFNKKIEPIKADFGFGNLQHTGRIDVKTLLENYRLYLKENQQFVEEKFEYNQLKVKENHQIEYKNITAKKIVFCEGFGLKKNPFFKQLPLNGTKGELITIYAPEVQIQSLIKSSVFVLPTKKNYYKVGATFNWTDKTNTPTQEAKEQLVQKLNTFFNAPYKVVAHTAGIRPTVIDRRPLLGTHSAYKNIAVFNGLGTRGVMMAPLLANELYNHLEENIPLRKEVSIERFKRG